jgi:hypothetical protein
MNAFFLTDYEKDVIIENEKYKSIITKYTKEGKLTLLEMSYLNDYFLEGGSLVNSNWFIELINKIELDELVNIIIKRMDKLFKKESDVKIKSKNKKINKQIIKDKIKYIEFTKDQRKAIKKILKFLPDFNSKSYGLYGYAGTGKTTIIVEILTFLLKNKIIRSVAFTAPTNKAVNVIKSKFRNNMKELYESYFDKEILNNFNFDETIDKFHEIGISIDFITIHKLLKYEIDYGYDGEIIFNKGTDGSLINNYEVIIIDECSMIPTTLIESIFNELRNNVRKKCDNYKKIPKIIFSGDPAQLPPVNELLSIVFMKDKSEFKYDEYLTKIKDDKHDFKEYVTDLHKHKYELLTDDITNMKSITLKKVMRSKLDSVTNICYQIRLWAIDKIKTPELQKHIKNGVYVYKHDNKIKKINNDWFKKCLEYYESGQNCNIILCWTNRQTDEYNTTIRKLLFGKKDIDRFVINDILMLNDFYNLDDGTTNIYNKSEDDENNKFYTSEQIKIVEIEKITKNIQNFSIKINKKASNLKNNKIYESAFKTTIDIINSNTTRNYLCWKLHVTRISESTEDLNEINTIYVLDDKSIKKWTAECDFVSNNIKKLRKNLISKFPDKTNIIEQHIIKPVWKELHKNMVQPFANVNYGYAITCHKGQGSNFYNVFVDTDDILKNGKDTEAKKCLYTAMTRASNELHILLS